MVNIAAALPFVGMVIAECAQVGLMILSKSAMATGMSNLIFVCYSNALASVVLLPFSLLCYRSERPQLSFKIICGLFVLGLLGCFAQIFGYAGINYSSATLATALLNLIPGFTFVLAIIFRMEKVNWRRSTTLAKSIGTIVSISGAFIVTLYKGPPLLSTPSNPSSFHSLLLQKSNWALAGLLLGADCVLASAWLIVQASILNIYPNELTVVFYYCFFVAIQSLIVSLVVERDSTSWSLKSQTRLIAVLYSAVFGSAIQVGISTWCMQRTGPVFVSMFKPLGIVISVFVGVIFLGDTFYLGSLIGAAVIVFGFYSVMWGKAKEAKINSEIGERRLESSEHQVPFLQNNTTR